MLSDELSKILHERDKLRRDLKDMANARTAAIAERDDEARKSREQVAMRDKEVKDLREEMQRATDELQRMEKQFKSMRAERDKLKHKIVRIKNRKLKVDVNQKLCRNCRREYLETENFNWSCRTH